MVDSELIDQIKKILYRARKFLVTGATGFVGHRVAQALAHAGHDVIATGRNRYLAPSETKFVRADISDTNKIQQLCSDREIVIHCASNTSPWGPYQKFATTNVQGTQNIVNGCMRHKVSRLIHISSTSVQFNFSDAFNLKEDSPLPEHFSCNYARTKHEAEEIVRSASADGLNAVIIRARAVIGPRDQNILPRILKVYDQGRLRQIGDGDNATDLTYIDNLVYAIVLAINHGASGETITVTGGEPVKLWKLIRRVLNESGRSAPLKKIPYFVAMLLANLFESSHRTFGNQTEPPMTKYTVGLLAKHQTFNGDRARTELKYRPLITQEEGIRRTIKSLTATNDSHSAVPVQLRLFTTGYTPQPFHFVERGANRKRVAIHATFALIEHPKYGLTLFDAGYGPRFYEASRRWPYRAHAKMTPVVTSQQRQCITTLRNADVDPRQVKRIIVSHFHSDHICGLRDFPEADIIATKEAWESVAGISGIAALRRAILPDLLPDDIKDRLFLLPTFVDPGIGPFSQCHDLFHDGSIRLINLPGHAHGQIGALVQTGDNKRALLLADAVWTRRTITQRLPPTLAFLALAANIRQAKKTLARLCDFHEIYPDIDLIPTHCRELAIQYGFDKHFPELDREEW